MRYEEKCDYLTHTQTNKSKELVLDLKWTKYK